MQSSEEFAGGRAAKEPSNARPSFFWNMSWVIALAVLVGFAPSFYLKPLGNPLNNAVARETLPAYIYIHGFVLTAWFALFLVQSILIRKRNLKSHRTLGWLGCGIAVVVVGLSGFVTYKSVARSIQGGIPPERLPLIVLGNFAILALFALLVTLAMAKRKQADWHRRLMTAGSIALLAPALARWPGAEALVPISVIAPQLGMLIAVAIHDRKALGRVHPATWTSIGLYVLRVFGTVPFAMSPAGADLVAKMR
jgi:uncharacterized membrane protein YozB (DUF420 family)